IFPFAYDVLNSVSESQAAHILAENAEKHHFRYDSQAPAKGELADFVDARLNAVIVKHLMRGLNAAIERDEINHSHCIAITDHIIADQERFVVPAFLSSVQEKAQDVVTQAPSKPIIYLCIGCGNGQMDLPAAEALKAAFPAANIHVVGFDPFQTEPEKN